MAFSNISNNSINSSSNIFINDKAGKSIFSTGDGTFMIWIYAFSSVIIISLCGLVPIVCMPRLQRSRYQNDLLQFLIGLAIGTLTADALLHLLPISGHKLALQRGTPSNSSSNHNDNHNDREENDHDHGHTHSSDEGFWFGFMALVGIVGFLVLERIMILLTDVCTHRDHTAASTKTDNELKGIGASVNEPHLHHHQNHHQHQHHQLNSKTKSFMFMIITGDGLHNFFDGIAIGVSYGSSLAVGLSTSIAILCHELPHEIGDFAMLIKAGMTIKRAVLYNSLSSILCLLGATTGVFIGKIDVGWVSALIAGMFLYISLVDMVPQLDCYPAEPAFKRAKKLLIQFSGISAGIAIMGLIATYESRLHSLISSYHHHNHN